MRVLTLLYCSDVPEQGRVSTEDELRTGGPLFLSSCNFQSALPCRLISAFPMNQLDLWNGNGLLWNGKGKAHPVALSLLINTSSKTPSTASGSGTEKGMSRGEGSVPFWDTCVWIWGGYGANLAAGMAGVVQDNGWARGAVAQLGWGAALPGSVLPAGRGWCLHSASFTSPHGTCPAPQYSWDHLVLPTQPLC